MESVLIISNHYESSGIIEKFLTKKGYLVHTHTVLEDSFKWIKENNVDLVLASCEFTRMKGPDILDRLKQIDPTIEVILLAQKGNIQEAMDACWKDVGDYLIYPILPEKLLESIERAMSHREKSKIRKKGNHHFISGVSKVFRKINEEINLVANTGMTVNIQGETGTGKEYIAREIHARSGRANKKFVAVDCGTFSKELAGSELFGHTKGAYTGAFTERKGYFEQANEGTLFLDEINNLSVDNQMKLLRVLQERKLRKVGSETEQPIDVRLLTASNQDLLESVNNGSFREDLYYRINEYAIILPPLHDRPEDIESFARHFLLLSNKELGKDIKGFSHEVIHKLKNYEWPGNLRQLKNVVKRMTLKCTEDQIGINFFPSEINGERIGHSNSRVKLDLSSGLPNDGLNAIVEEVEKLTILEVLEQTEFNKAEAARILNIDRKTLYNKLNAYAIDLQEDEG